MSEFYKNYTYDDIFHAKPYLDTMKLQQVKLNCIL